MKYIRNLISIFALLSFATYVNSQDLSTLADKDPLSTAFYLLSTTEKHAKNEEKACLTKSLANAERYDEIVSAARLVEEDSYAEQDLVKVVNELVVRGKPKEASQFLTFLIERFRGNSYRLQLVLKPLVQLKRDSDAVSIVNGFDDSDRIDGSFALANVYFEFGRREEALGVLTKITDIVDKSRYGEEKADLGLYYAKLGKEVESLQWLRESMKGLSWISGKPEYTEGRIIDRVVEAYKLLGKHVEATELLTKQGLVEEPRDVIDEAETEVRNGNSRKALELLLKAERVLRPEEYWSTYDIARIASIYLNLGDANKALDRANALTENIRERHQVLLDISDFYIKKKDRSKAKKILDHTYDNSLTIDITEPEDGRLWTSGKWDQARYQYQIIERLIDLRFDEEALLAISKLTKPYLKAFALTEFVSRNKKRIERTRLNTYLDQSRLLLEQKMDGIFDLKKLEVFAITARTFAQIGNENRANQVFAEGLTKLDLEMMESGSDSSLLFGLCLIGVEFEKSKVDSTAPVRDALRRIIKNWKDEKY